MHSHIKPTSLSKGVKGKVWSSSRTPKDGGADLNARAEQLIESSCTLLIAVKAVASKCLSSVSFAARSASCAVFAASSCSGQVGRPGGQPLAQNHAVRSASTLTFSGSLQREKISSERWKCSSTTFPLPPRASAPQSAQWPGPPWRAPPPSCPRETLWRKLPPFGFWGLTRAVRVPGPSPAL